MNIIIHDCKCSNLTCIGQRKVRRLISQQSKATPVRSARITNNKSKRNSLESFEGCLLLCDQLRSDGFDWIWPSLWRSVTRTCPEQRQRTLKSVHHSLTSPFQRQPTTHTSINNHHTYLPISQKSKLSSSEMAPTITPDDTAKFLICCIRFKDGDKVSTQNALTQDPLADTRKISFDKVAAECNITKAAA
jgi:hypothetical protein